MSRVYEHPFGSLVDFGPFTTTSANADPIIGQHAIHWVLSKETYATSRRKEIDGWNLVGETVDTCMYHLEDRAIIAFRGSQTLADVKADVQLSRPGGNGCNFDKMAPALAMVEAFITENPDVEIQLTGHSLGGAIARCAGQKLGLGIVTFNGAAPPSNPVSTGPNEVDYHIVFDLISAWENPNTIRIDKGYRPAQYGRLDPRRWLDLSVGPVFRAHLIENFSNEKVGKITSTVGENFIILSWYNRLPQLLKDAFNAFTQTNRLPAVG